VKTHTHGTRQWALKSLPSSLPKTALPETFAPGHPSGPLLHSLSTPRSACSGALRRGCCAALAAQEEPWAGRGRQRVALGGSRGHAREALAQKCHCRVGREVAHPGPSPDPDKEISTIRLFR